MIIREPPAECISWFRSDIEYYDGKIVLRLQCWKWFTFYRNGDILFSTFIDRDWKVEKTARIIEQSSKPQLVIQDGKFMIKINGWNRINFWILTDEEKRVLPEQIREINALLAEWNGIQELIEEIPERVKHIFIHEGKEYESFRPDKA